MQLKQLTAIVVLAAAVNAAPTQQSSSAMTGKKSSGKTCSGARQENISQQDGLVHKDIPAYVRSLDGYDVFYTKQGGNIYSRRVKSQSDVDRDDRQVQHIPVRQSDMKGIHARDADSDESQWEDMRAPSDWFIVDKPVDLKADVHSQEKSSSLFPREILLEGMKGFATKRPVFWKQDQMRNREVVADDNDGKYDQASAQKRRHHHKPGKTGGVEAHVEKGDPNDVDSFSGHGDQQFSQQSRHMNQFQGKDRISLAAFGQQDEMKNREVLTDADDGIYDQASAQKHRHHHKPGKTGSVEARVEIQKGDPNDVDSFSGRGDQQSSQQSRNMNQSQGKDHSFMKIGMKPQHDRVSEGAAGQSQL